ncbi:putative RDD family membrane protein YckC [Lipingzhangella halophila]|uniref:Putative RDD family membrane protein YckC n=1 Tax=Lipingzhangella halophila TaxID=1783352 RepID=A0A7W7RFH7_9ACTN|nr:RDD family protein [Lipingzhangella halophila]MBB4931011.1 putative RDD family membrane protein YckC [Lipingzhangella halophila]
MVADRGERFLARLIDVMIAQAVSVCALVPALIVIVPIASPGRGELVIFLICALFFLVYWGYEIFCHRRFGATIGKRMLDLRVVRPGNNGESDPAPETRIMLRAAVWAAPLLVSWGIIINLLSGVFWFVNILWPIWDQPSRQALHDKAAGTMVVRQR